MRESLRLYWWTPLRPVKSFATEVRWHASAWGRLRAAGGGLRNFGDEVGRDVVEEVSRRKVVWSPIERADVVSVGSILSSVLRRGASPVVFGSGLREPVQLDPATDLPEFISVRGDLTRSALGLSPELPIADPGIIVSALYGRLPAASVRQATFVPHFAMLGTSAGRSVVSRYRAAGWRVVLPNLSPRDMAAAIAAASIVVTTSLHAIVFAHSYGVPVAKLSLPGASAEPDFKYLDYSSALSLDVPQVSIDQSLQRSTASLLEEWEPVTLLVDARVPTLIESVYRAARVLA